MSIWAKLFGQHVRSADLMAGLRVITLEQRHLRLQLGHMWRELMRNQQQYNEAIAALTTEVAQVNNIADSAVALIVGLRKQLNDMIVQNDGLVPVEQIQSLASSLDVGTRKLADAISANVGPSAPETTPADPSTGSTTGANNVSNAPTGVLNPDPRPPGGSDKEGMGMGSAPEAGKDFTTHTSPDLQSENVLVNADTPTSTLTGDPVVPTDKPDDAARDADAAEGRPEDNPAIGENDKSGTKPPKNTKGGFVKDGNDI